MKRGIGVFVSARERERERERESLLERLLMNNLIRVEIRRRNSQNKNFFFSIFFCSIKKKLKSVFKFGN